MVGVCLFTDLERDLRACLERTLDTFLEYTGPIRFILNQKILSVVWLQDVSLRLSLLS